MRWGAVCAVFLMSAIGVFAGDVCVPEFSTAGFFAVEGSPRQAESLNPGWRFHKGDVKGAEVRDFNDNAWQNVDLPHGIELVPLEVSGCANYQGVVWYRKHFTPSDALNGKKLFVHFEAVMGKCKVYLNGKLLRENFGGYLPFSVDVTDGIEFGKENVIAVRADNSDDPDYPPGKPQSTLDFTYMGGIYRDVWLVSHEKVYLTEATHVNQVAGGGMFVWFTDVSEASAKVHLKIDVKNESKDPVDAVFMPEIVGVAMPDMRSSIHNLAAGESKIMEMSVVIQNPKLWSPDSPNLYQVIVRLKDKDGHLLDCFRQRFGIRSFEFKGKEGFWLNGKPYGSPIIGGNRHQDFAVIGNAVPNSLHWRDAKKMRDIGMKAVRNAHCPQDPAFMDACDELGLLVIVNNPGWQFWNNKEVFKNRVKDDIRQMVRRDRNHASLWFWEPVLNETWYPADAAKEWRDIVHQEYPCPSCYCASDNHSKGAEHFPIHYAHPVKPGAIHKAEKSLPGITYFTREWGDCVDNWSSHNSPSRAAMGWGEQAQLIQAKHYANPGYNVTCLNTLYSMDSEYVGGTLWHTFDHQRGYHPDPFYGGVMDNFRQPKYSARMFHSQQPPSEIGGYVTIAHEMTPFSPSDVTVYSNCDSVRLTTSYGDKKTSAQVIERNVGPKGIRYPIMVFKDAWNFMSDKFGEQGKTRLFAEGFIDGKCMATNEIRPTRRPNKLLLRIDDNGVPLTADGSDMVTVVAAISDGTSIKRLNNESVTFTIEGEGRLVGDIVTGTNPRPFIWGTAPILVRATDKPGKIKVTARLTFEGSQKASPVTLEFESVPSRFSLIGTASKAPISSSMTRGNKSVERGVKTEGMKEVENMQNAFGEF